MAVGIGVVCFTYWVKIAQNRPARQLVAGQPACHGVARAVEQLGYLFDCEQGVHDSVSFGQLRTASGHSSGSSMVFARALRVE